MRLSCNTISLAVGQLVALLVLAGCDDKPERGAPATSASAPAPTATASADLSPTGVKACDDYIAAAAACMKKPGADREQLRISIAQQRNQVAQAKSDSAKEMVAIGCEAELEALGEDPTCK